MHVQLIAAGPLGQDRVYNLVDNCPVRKQYSWACLQVYNRKLGILHGSGAATSNPGSTIQVRNNKAPLRTIGLKNYSTKVVSNNGNSIYGWNTTSNNNTGGWYHDTKHSQHASLQNATTNVHRRVWYLWRMEVQVSSIHGTNGLSITATTGELREFNNNHQRSRSCSSSKYNRRSKHKWIQLSTDLRYILVNVCPGSAATICRQHQTHNGFEIYRQLCSRFSIPVGTRPIGYLTKLLKPTFDVNNFEETFSQWEFELNKFERDNGQALPESVKIAVLLNETKGPLTTTTFAAASRTITELQHREDNNNRNQIWYKTIP